MFSNLFGITKKRPWNQRRLLGQKPPLKLKEVWAIRIPLQLAGRLRDLALFNLAIDSKLRACDLIRLRVQDVCLSGRIVSRAVVIQQKTHRPVQFEVTEQTRSALSSWIHHRHLQAQDYVFPSRIKSPHTRPDASTPGSFRHGSQTSGLIRQPMARIRSGARRRL